jgi:phosphatidate cytidylyltransferase
VRARVITALVVIPFVLAAVFWTGIWPLITIGGLCAIWTSQELAGLVGAKFPPVLGFAAHLHLSLLIGFGLISTSLAATIVAGLSLLGIVGGILVHRTRSRLAVELASLWVTVPLAAIPLLHLASHQGSVSGWNWASLVLMVLLPLWAGDTAAIFVGLKFGRTKLAPAISPKKSVEGGIGNLLAAVVVAAVLGPALGIHVGLAVAAGVAVGLLGQVGDLFESALKRKVGVKDSGTILPGHGGLLDRLDSLLFAAPAVALILLGFIG